MNIKTTLLALTLGTTLATNTMAADYKIDTDGMHASVLFKISHLGTSWLYGRFEKFGGTFSYDSDKPNDSKITMNVDTTSVDTNHAERNIHIQAPGLLETGKYKNATFTSTKFNWQNDKKGTVTGTFKLHGTEKTVTMAIEKVGEGKDPWGGYRVGFEGTMTIKVADYGMTKNLGPASETLELIVAIEGVRQ